MARRGSQIGFACNIAMSVVPHSPVPLRRIAAITMARSEYGSFLPVLSSLQNDPTIDLRVVVAGSHLCKEFGNTVEMIAADGIDIAERVETQLGSFSCTGIAKSIGLGTIGLADAFQRLQPDLVFVIGDRWELLSVASAALALRIPVAHHSGGDLTQGAFDNQVRFAVSQMSHVHMVGLPAHAKRLAQIGEEEWRVHVTGEPALDQLNDIEFLSETELAQSLDVHWQPPLAMATYHPTTLSELSARDEVNVFTEALEQVPGTIIISAPNADTDRDIMADALSEFASKHERMVFVPSLGQRRYYSLMNIADLMIGNSSSGIWESPSFQLPVVNIGSRQDGRHRAGNVIEAPLDVPGVLLAVKRALSADFKNSLREISNPYGDGHAAERISDILRTVELDSRLLQKCFVDFNSSARKAVDAA